MQITVILPDDLAQHPNPGREALEALAIEGYRTEALSQYQAAQLLGMGRLEFESFLHERKVNDHAYDVQDLLDDLETIKLLEEEQKTRQQSVSAA